MKIVHKNQAKEFKNSDACIAFEYQLEDKDINGTIIELNGRYPSKGKAVNLKCKELAYIIEGSGKIVIQKEETKLNQRDMVLIQPGEEYFWEGNLKMLLCCSPAWSPEQYKEIDS